MTPSPLSEESTTNEIEISSLEKIYPPELQALHTLDLQITRGEFVSFVGPSGCGKSTLLRIIAGLDIPTKGRISVQTSNRLSCVFQDPNLLPWRDALSNICLPLEIRGVSKRPREEAATEALERVGLKDFARSYPHELSGGMKMRVSLARALVTGPSLLLLDEPFAALDEITRQRLDEDLRALWIRSQMTVVFVTHSIHEAAFLSNRVLVFSERPGRIVLDRKPELPKDRTRQTKTSAAYMSELSVLYEALEGTDR